ncbi:MAG: coproporphyrinogen dehydrogenase HemZ [Oscillospiraceae bacterium]
MLIALNNFCHNYEIEQLTRMFTKDTTVESCAKHPTIGAQDYIYIRKNEKRIFLALYYNNVLYKAFLQSDGDKGEQEARVCAAAYGFYTQAFKKNLPWGMLTGVRPVRLMRNLYKEWKDIEAVEKIFSERYFVSKEKIKLCRDIFMLQKPIVRDIAAKDYSLYISIPFCPSKCSYCTFTSTPSKNAEGLMESYVEKLCQEIAYTAKNAQALGLVLKTIYIGGGTPTAISAQQLARVMGAVEDNFDLSRVLEYSVEAGRPDCTTYEKLAVIKAYKADRVSINPQTFSDEVLAAIGRKHTHQDFLDCYKLAKELNFKTINTDLIAGLPKDTVESFENSLRGCVKLGAENITVHTLTLKRASTLAKTDSEQGANCDVGEMIAKNSILTKSGYVPYYMYRQKATLQNLENVGFSQPYHESLYNIYIMEELETIVSCGAGAVSKVIGENGEIKRVYNYKYPTEYVKGFAEILNRKDEVYNLWRQYGYQNG